MGPAVGKKGGRASETEIVSDLHISASQKIKKEKLRKKHISALQKIKKKKKKLRKKGVQHEDFPGGHPS